MCAIWHNVKEPLQSSRPQAASVCSVQEFVLPSNTMNTGSFANDQFISKGIYEIVSTRFSSWTHPTWWPPCPAQRAELASGPFGADSRPFCKLTVSSWGHLFSLRLWWVTSCSCQSTEGRSQLFLVKLGQPTPSAPGPMLGTYLSGQKSPERNLHTGQGLRECQAARLSTQSFQKTSKPFSSVELLGQFCKTVIIFPLRTLGRSQT
jgi:hypothetical protein